METVHPVHIHMKKVLPRTYRVYGNGTPSTYSYEKGTPPGHRVHGNGTPSTYYIKKGTPQDIGSKETVHPVHITYKKVLLQDTGSMETVHPVHITQNSHIHKTQYIVRRTLCNHFQTPEILSNVRRHYWLLLSKGMTFPQYQYTYFNALRPINVISISLI